MQRICQENFIISICITQNYLRRKKGKIADQVICQMDKLDTKFLQEIALLRCEVVSFYEGEKLCLVFSTCGFGEIRCWITKDGWFELSSRDAT